MSAFKEIEIENFIWGRIKNDLADLRERGLHLNAGHYYRQFTMPGCGIADLVGFVPTVDKLNILYVNINIYELKRGQVEPKNLTQLLRYMSFFHEHTEEISERIGHGAEISVNGCLIGNSFDKEVLAIKNVLDWSPEFYAFQIDIEKGIVFHEAECSYYNGDNNFSLLMPRLNFDHLMENPNETESHSEETEQKFPGESSEPYLAPF